MLVKRFLQYVLLEYLIPRSQYYLDNGIISWLSIFGNSSPNLYYGKAKFIIHHEMLTLSMKALAANTLGKVYSDYFAAIVIRTHLDDEVGLMCVTK